MAGLSPNTWCHVEIPATDVARARGFYGTVFGWKFTHIPQMDYTLYATGDGEIGGGLSLPQPGAPQMLVNYVNVTSIEATAAKIEAAGGAVLQPKFEVPGAGWISIVQDTEGNVFGLWKGMNPPPAEAPAKKARKKAPRKAGGKKPARKPAKKSAATKRKR